MAKIELKNLEVGNYYKLYSRSPYDERYDPLTTQFFLLTKKEKPSTQENRFILTFEGFSNLDGKVNSARLPSGVDTIFVQMPSAAPTTKGGKRKTRKAKKSRKAKKTRKY